MMFIILSTLLFGTFLFMTFKDDDIPLFLKRTEPKALECPQEPLGRPYSPSNNLPAVITSNPMNDWEEYSVIHIYDATAKLSKKRVTKRKWNIYECKWEYIELDVPSDYVFQSRREARLKEREHTPYFQGFQAFDGEKFMTCSYEELQKACPYKLPSQDANEWYIGYWQAAKSHWYSINKTNDEPTNVSYHDYCD